MTKTVAVLGLDGLSWNYLDKLFNNGVMPYTRSLLERGFKTDLECIPPVTSPSWTSIMTGVNPGKHGIFGFFMYDKITWKQILISANHVEHPRIHEMLSMNGIKSIVFNPIPDYPLIPASNTIQISNLFFTPKPVSYPAEAYKKFFGGEDPKKYTEDLTCNYLKDYIHVIELYEEAIDKAVNEEHSLLWVNLNIPDSLFHRCPKILETSDVIIEERKIFEKVDKIIKSLRESHDSLVIVSDHGYAMYNKLVSVNDILVKHRLASGTTERKFYEVGDYGMTKGLTKLKSSKRIYVHPKLYSLVRKLHLSRVARLALNVISEILGRRIEVKTSMWVDPDNSLAFLPDHYAFGVYLKDKSVKEEVKNVLRMYSDALIVEDPENVYHGPYVGRAADVVVFPNFFEGYWLVGSYIVGSPILDAWLSAHFPIGVLAIHSDYPLPENPPEKLPNYAVATIVLSLLEQPLPKSRDKVEYVEETFAGKLPEKNYLSRWLLRKKIRILKRDLSRSALKTS